MTQRAYAEHAGITHGYVNYLVKKGMPMDSMEAADAWRQKNVRRRSDFTKDLPPQQDHTAIEQEGPYRPAEASNPPTRDNGKSSVRPTTWPSKPSGEAGPTPGVWWPSTPRLPRP